MKAILLLEDGMVFEGKGFGAEGHRCGEVVFNTSMSGYQEILTDPSYEEQIVTMTYPLIGNYGVNKADCESKKVHVAGFVVKENCAYPSNWRSTESLSDYLKQHKVVGIEGIDTRMLVKHIREKGAMKGIISCGSTPQATLQRKLADYPGLIGRDLVRGVTTKKAYGWDKGLVNIFSEEVERTQRDYRVVAFDFGVKHNILRLLSQRCEVQVVPGNTSAEDVLARKPDGVFLSNGPGDPEPVDYAIKTIRKLLGRTTVFGICLGHQLLGLALGGKTFKLKFGHRGANHPVKNLQTGKIEITSQNHGFCVDIDSLMDKDVELTHMNLNDETLEGFRCRDMPAFCVQYHPEASPGPHDSRYLFDEFFRLMDEQSNRPRR